MRPTITIRQGRNGLWFYHTQARNGEIINDGAQGYTRKEDAVRAAKSARWTMIFARIVVDEVAE